MKKISKNARLSSDVVPTRYEISLTPDLEKFVFDGEEIVHLTLKKSTKTITLHAKELMVQEVRIDRAGKQMEATKISYNKKAETVTFSFAQPILKGEVQLYVRFRGTLNDKMRGFYRSSFEHKGKTHHIAITQFESTDARCAIPCIDEPAVKAVFDVTLVVPKDKVTISNTIPVETNNLEGGRKAVRFAPTPRMSTYLLAFIVGDFEYVEKKSADGVLVRVFTTPGKKHQAQFALECAAKTITFFNKYFAIRYPLPVLDMIAIPDFAAGAMENWGAITYRETALLVDAKNSSTMNKQWVALVIAHEIAHQWFGNLVTMDWWTHLWLNEGFASYIEYLAVDHLFPDWDMWTQFLHADMRPAFQLDALKNTHPIEVEVHHPSEIAAVFDAVSYSKGASVIRMIAEYLGEKHFRDGLRYYLKKHSYGNTVTEDLWDALEKVSKKPVRKIMAGWTAMAGYPFLTVSEHEGKLLIKQKRFFSSPLSANRNKSTSIWEVPMRLVTDKGAAKERALITQNETRLTIPRGTWVKCNADESGFYRTLYAPGLRTRLGVAARKKQLKTRDRLGLIRDMFAFAENGTLSAEDALRFVAHYTSEDAYVIWAEIVSSLASIHSLIAHEIFLDAFEIRVRSLMGHIGTMYTWTTKPKNHSEALLKVLVLGTLGKYGDDGVRAHAAKLLERTSGTKNSIPADLRGIVYAISARFGGKKEFDALMRVYKEATLHEEKNRIASALGNFRDTALLQKTLTFAMSDAVRLQDKTRVIAGVTTNPAGTDLSWKFVQKHWKQFAQKYASGRELSHLIEPMRVSTSEKHAEEIERFFKKHPTPGTERTVKQVCEHIRANAAWLKRNRSSLAEFFA